jgi:carbonic anhydrase/acetyltransferase-like protein (isoleucine patch superfamily)
MHLYEIDGKSPKISPDVAFIADSVVIIGDVYIGAGVVIFDNVVLEGYPMSIFIDDYTNIQSGTIVHGLTDSPTKIGKYVTIGHRSVLHGCYLDDYSTVGMGSIVMGYSKIGKGCVIGAGSLVTERKTFEPRSLILGSPAKFVKELPESAIEEAKKIALMYTDHGRSHLATMKRLN